MRGFPTNKTVLQCLLCMAIFSACGNNDREAGKTVSHAAHEKPTIVCDTAAIDIPPVKKNSPTLNVWLETTSLEWFLENRQSAWREARTWSHKLVSIDTIVVLNCIAAERKELFLYIPHNFYKKEKTGSEYFNCYIVNNSADTVLLPMIDAVVANISSSVRLNKKDSAASWLLFQKTTSFAECGNSFHNASLAPRKAVAASIECNFLNLGNEPAAYRIELSLNGKTIVSNSIDIHLMPGQLPFLGKDFN